MLFIDFSCLGQQFIYQQDQYWKNFWFNVATSYPEISIKLVAAEESGVSIAELPANCELISIRINKLVGLFSGDKAFANAVKPLIDAKNAVWITNQISHMPGGDTMQLLWVDDLDWLKFPQWQMLSRKNTDRKDWLNKSRNVQHTVATSTYYTEVLKNELNIPGTSIASFPFFYSPYIKPASWAEKESVKTQYTRGNDFFVFVGDIHHRHHITRLLKAYTIFKKWQKSSMQLVIMGNSTEYSQEILQSVETYKYREDVVIITDADDQEKLKVLSAAYACLYTAESIALPVTMPAAMKAGIPLIVSDLPQIREWGLDHVLYASATDEAQIAEKMILLFKDESLRAEKVKNALQFIDTFSNDKSGASLFAVLHSRFPANFAATIN